MKNLKLELFRFKNGLTIEQADVAKIIEMHLENYDDLSEKELKESLETYLKDFKFYPEVRKLLEDINNELDKTPLIYELKDLYKKIERKNYGALYRPALNVILNIINKEDDESRMESIFNELIIYDWIPEVKFFLMKMTSSPIEIQNLKNSGKASKVFTIVEKVEEGHLVYIINRWFLITDDEIKQVVPDDYIENPERIENIRNLEAVFNIAEIEEDFIIFKIDENLTIKVSVFDGGEIYLNDEKLDKEETLESLFASPLIPYLKKNLYQLIETTINNISKFVELDIALKVSNVVNPFTEAVCFNYKNKMYVYYIDSRYGIKFVEYLNAHDLIADIQKEFDYDITHFYKDKVSKEVKTLKKLEDREAQINLKLQDVNESIKMLMENKELFDENKELKLLYNNLLVYKHNLITELNNIKANKSSTRKNIQNNI